MNEIRKKIIELIEFYMEKEVKRWCILLMQNGKFIDVNWDFQYDWPWDYIDDMYILASDLKKWAKWDNIVNKIIWHYDITAVDKYLFFEKNIYNIVKWNVKILYLWNKEIWNIPNKPIHLYTEQEEKDLLELLNKLK